jgi:predicted CXXCH cytochrome family protein
LDAAPLTRNRSKSRAKPKSAKTQAPRPEAKRAAEGADATSAARSSWADMTWGAIFGAAALVFLGGAGAYWWNGADWPPSAAGTGEKLAFVGSDTCAACHRDEAKLWHGSQHAHAMAHASDKTVLGNFNDASFDYYGVHSRFFKKDGKFFVETDGPDGKLATFEVKYTFGLDPLQQYLVEFPDGRVQALSLAWDSRPKAEGGQRWFHLYPHEEIRHDDVLHWTKLNQNWNFMCAECHSTGVRKNYDAATDSFHTTWAEISVGCETCHGQGSRHVVWAKGLSPSAKSDPDMGLLVRFDERRGVTWSRDAKTNPQRSAAPAQLRKEVETCGLCHARRGQMSEDWVPGHPLSDTHVVALMTQGIYQPDGQMQDEVYNYGSFKQSKMFAKGVTCSDCHDPHSAKLKLSGDKVCLQCHAETYATAAHSHHEGVSPAVSCVSCHMPARTFMVIDKRHDHSFRVPRPDLSTKLGTNNACTDCHTDKSSDWAAAAIAGWFGPERQGFQTYGAAFHAAWNDEADAQKLLTAVVHDPQTPAFARASALEALTLSRSTLALAQKNLSDPDPLVRISALDMLDGVPAGQLWPLVSPLLTDPVRGVRIRAASLLAGMPTAGLSQEDRTKLDKAVKEFIASNEFNADRPESRSTLANFYARHGDTAKAEAEYKTALRLSPSFAPAAANLADLYRQLGREPDAEKVLRQALERSPQDAGLHHALGLALVRLKREDEALVELGRAAELEPARARYAYVYAVALGSKGRLDEAIKVLEQSLARHPGDRDTLLGLIGINRNAGNAGAALRYAERLAKSEPGNTELNALIKSLRAQTGNSAP